MFVLSDNNQADVVEALKSTSKYLDDLLNIDNPYFGQMVSQIYTTEPRSLPMAYTFCNLFILPEYVLMLMSSATT